MVAVHDVEAALGSVGMKADGSGEAGGALIICAYKCREKGRFCFNLIKKGALKTGIMHTFIIKCPMSYGSIRDDGPLQGPVQML